MLRYPFLRAAHLAALVVTLTSASAAGRDLLGPANGGFETPGVTDWSGPITWDDPVFSPGGAVEGDHYASIYTGGAPFTSMTLVMPAGLNVPVSLTGYVAGGTTTGGPQPVNYRVRLYDGHGGGQLLDEWSMPFWAGSFAWTPIGPLTGTCQSGEITIEAAMVWQGGLCQSLVLHVDGFVLDGILDCNGNGIDDPQDILSGTSEDCDGNGVPDECDPDCNQNGIPDACDLSAGTSTDCNSNDVPDECDLDCGTSVDCNVNTVPDECDIAAGTSLDCNENDVPDECDLDSGASPDCNANSIPDECDIASGTSHDCNSTGIPDECETDCNGNGLADECDVAAGTSQDCNGNTIPDECEVGVEWRITNVTTGAIYCTLQDALDAAVAGDEIVAQPGTYAWPGGDMTGLRFHGKSVTLRSTDPEDPAVVAATVIDCMSAGRAASYISGEGPDAVLAGFTVTNGSLGGIYCSGSSPTITKCRVVDNVRSGIICYGGSPTITDCLISGNGGQTGHDGGGIRCEDGCDLMVSGCEITGNYASDGGGISVYLASATILDCIISGNEGSVRGGGIRGRNSSSLVIAGCVISENDSIYGGGVYSNIQDTIITNCAFIANSSSRGGGIEFSSDGATVANCVFVGNSASSYGGGLLASYASNIRAINCTFVGNTANYGGAVDSGSSPGVAVINSTLWGNASAHGPELSVRHSLHIPGELSVTYSNVQGGQAAAYVSEESTLHWGAGNIDADPLFVDPDGLDDDPATWADNDYQLREASPCIDAADNTAVPEDLTDLDGDGDTMERLPLDLDGNPRFIGMDPPGGNGVPDPPDYPDIVDMGAYEAYPKAPADFNEDGHVDHHDVNAFLQCTSGQAVPLAPGCEDKDLDGDSDVDQSDFGILQRCHSGEDIPAEPSCAD